MNSLNGATTVWLQSLVLAGATFVFFALPAILVIGPAPPWEGGLWAVSIALFCILIWQVGTTTFRRRFGIFALGAAFGLANVMLTISFVTQGHALNSAFFAHLDLSSLAIAWKVEKPRLLAAFGYCLAAPFVAVWSASRLHTFLPVLATRSISVAPILLVMLATFYPLTSFINHFIATRTASERMLSELAALAQSTGPVRSATVAQKNLILIYLEGLEQNYTDPLLFENLTPNLHKLRNDALWFSNIEQYPGTSWTIGGMVSSQCGVPLLSEKGGNSILAEANNPFSQVTCLAEYLRDDGYRTAYLGGASLAFAGKGRFLSDNGYDLTLGQDEIPSSVSHTWGLYDSVLFENSRRIFDRLANLNEPFLLSMLTLDTHNPIGHPSPGCPDYGDGTDEMLNAVHCTDTLLGAFMDHVRASSVGEDTVIALVSDHLLISGEAVSALSRKDRKITFVIFDPSRDGQTFEGAATHFDIAPTILETLGKTDAEFYFGHSLLQNSQGRVFERNLSEEDFLGFTVEALLSASQRASQ